MSLELSLEQYIASVKMSKKCRVLVEGKDDKAHFTNLLHIKIDNKSKRKVKVDTAEQLKGESLKTAKCNRAQIEEIYERIKGDEQYDNLFLLCDREFKNFEIDEYISEQTDNSTVNSNLYLTEGHSFENYFFLEEVLINAFSYLTSYEFKNEAIDLLKNNFNEVFNIVSNISLTARDINIANYPNGHIQWDNFNVSNDCISFSIEDWALSQKDVHCERFKSSYSSNREIVLKTDHSICIKISRGHTAVVMLQRIFAFCLYVAGREENENEALKEAKRFKGLSEAQISASLSQSWLDSLNKGSKNYPVDLISDISIYTNQAIN